MASIHDVEAIKVIESAAKEFSKNPDMAKPEWAEFVKSGSHVERPPAQEDWWQIRAAALLRTIYKDGPVGVSKLRTKYGGRRNRGLKPHRFQKAGGKIIRTMLQQLEKIGLVQQAKKGSKGRIITPQGQAFLDNISNQIAGINNKAKSAPAKKETKVEAPKEEKKAETKEVKETPKVEEKKDSAEPVKEKENKENVIKENIGKEDKTNKSTKTN